MENSDPSSAPFASSPQGCVCRGGGASENAQAGFRAQSTLSQALPNFMEYYFYSSLQESVAYCPELQLNFYGCVPRAAGRGTACV